jgi:hypothetical protein
MGEQGAVQGFQHETVAAEANHNIGLSEAGIAMKVNQALPTLLRHGRAGGQHTNPFHTAKRASRIGKISDRLLVHPAQPSLR